MDNSVTSAIRDIITVLDEEIAAAQATLDRLKLERQGAEAVLKRVRDKPSTSQIVPAPAPAPAPSREAPSPVSQPTQQTEITEDQGLAARVLGLVRAADRPTSVGELVEQTGLDVTQVRSAVGYLKRKEAIHRVDRGLYRAAGPTDTEAAPAGAETASDTPHTHMKGGSAHGTVSDGVRNLDSLREAVNRDHRHGASVVEALG